MKGPYVLSPGTRQAVELLGSQIRSTRLERHWTIADLAERVGVSPVTIRKIEKGDGTVALGTAFEAAVLVGVTLFHDDPDRRALERDHVASRLAVLPAAARHRSADDDF